MLEKLADVERRVASVFDKQSQATEGVELKDTRAITTSQARTMKSASLMKAPQSKIEELYSRSHFVYSFEEELYESRVYARNRTELRYSIASPPSTKSPTLNLSFFRSLNLSDVSNISIVGLLVSSAEVYNGTRYEEEPERRPSTNKQSLKPYEGVEDKSGTIHQHVQDTILHRASPEKRDTGLQSGGTPEKNIWLLPLLRSYSWVKDTLVSRPKLILPRSSENEQLSRSLERLKNDTSRLKTRLCLDNNSWMQVAELRAEKWAREQEFLTTIGDECLLQVTQLFGTDHSFVDGYYIRTFDFRKELEQLCYEKCLMQIVQDRLSKEAKELTSLYKGSRELIPTITQSRDIITNPYRSAVFAWAVEDLIVIHERLENRHLEVLNMTAEHARHCSAFVPNFWIDQSRK